MNDSVRKSGITVIGARDFLVAYNVNLNTTSTRRANAIAFDIREAGRVVNDPKTGKPKTDVNNSDASMKNVPLRGYRMLKDFQYKGKGVWEDGTIYDPESGNTYTSVITMKDANTLDIRGYVGVKTFGRSDTWRKLKVN